MNSSLRKEIKSQQIFPSDEAAFKLVNLAMRNISETGFSCWSPVQYGWIRQGQSKRLEQTAVRGKRVSLIGVLEPEVSFDAAYRIVSITSKEYIEIMDRQADLAADLFLLHRVITVITQDNSSTHTSKAVQLKISE